MQFKLMIAFRQTPREETWELQNISYSSLILQLNLTQEYNAFVTGLIGVKPFAVKLRSNGKRCNGN